MSGRDPSGVFKHRSRVPAVREQGKPLSVALNNDYLAVGDAGHTYLVNGADFVQSGSGGVVDIYEKSGDTWALVSSIQPDDLTGFDNFGTSIDLSGDTLLVGAYGQNRLEPNVLI